MQSVFTSICAELANGNVVNIPVNLLKISTELRDVNEEFVSELSLNAMDFGMMQNILVSIDEKDQNFKVLDGNHRVQVAIDLDLEFVPAKLLPMDKPNTALLVSKMSTLTHSTIELALLCKDALTEGAAQKDLAERFNIHKSKVSELIKIAMELPVVIQEAAKVDPHKFNHMTLLKLARLSGDEQMNEFELIKTGKKQKGARFSSFMKQLDDDKLAKKKLTSDDIALLRAIADKIQKVLDDPQFHAKAVQAVEQTASAPVANSPVKEAAQSTGIATEGVVDNAESIGTCPDVANEAA